MQLKCCFFNSSFFHNQIFYAVTVLKKTWTNIEVGKLFFLISNVSPKCKQTTVFWTTVSHSVLCKGVFVFWVWTNGDGSDSDSIHRRVGEQEPQGGAYLWRQQWVGRSSNSGGDVLHGFSSNVMNNGIILKNRHTILWQESKKDTQVHFLSSPSQVDEHFCYKITEQ